MHPSPVDPMSSTRRAPASHDSSALPQSVVATVDDVLPQLGLAYLRDIEGLASWAVTRSTPGVGLAHLTPGRRVLLTLEVHAGSQLVTAYSLLD